MKKSGYIALAICFKNEILFLIKIGLFTLLVYGHAFSQEPIHYTTKNGLPSNVVYKTIQDNDGFIWIATDKGIAKFDGETFKVFTVNDGLPSNDIWEIFHTPANNRIWFFCKHKEQGYIYKDRVYAFNNSENAILRPSSFAINDSTIAFSDFDVGVFNFNNNISWQKHSLSPNHKKIKEKFNAKLPTSKHIYWEDNPNYSIGVNNINSYIIDSSYNILNIFNHIYIGKDITSRDLGFNINKHSYYKYLYIYTNEIFIALLNLKDTSLYIIPTNSLGYNVDYIEHIRFQWSDSVFQITIDKQFIIITPQGKIISKEYIDCGNKVNRFYKDKEENLWISTFGNGLLLYPKQILYNNIQFPQYAIQQIEKADNKLLIGINREGFFKYNTQKDSFELLIKSTEIIYNIKKLKFSNQYILLTYTNMLFLDSLVSFTFKYPEKEFKVVKGAKDLELFNNKYYGIFSNSFSTFDINFKNITNIERKNWLKNNYGYSFPGLLKLEVFDNKMYTCGTSGLYYFDNDTLIAVIKDEPLVNLFNFNNKFLLIARESGGLYLYNADTSFNFISLKKFYIHNFYIDSINNIWLSTNNGIHVLEINNQHPDSSKIINSFYEEDGLPDNNVNDLTFYNGKLYVATDFGVCTINPSDKIYKTNPKIYIKSINYNNKFTTDSILSIPFNQASNISINYGIIKYNIPKHTSYSYRILPKQQEWTASSSKSVTISNLKPGKYIIEFKATDHHFNTSVIKTVLHITPMWWQSIYAKILYALIFLSLITLVAWLVRRITLKQVNKKNELEKRIAGLELMALRSQLNPHFVFNSLNSIHHYIQNHNFEKTETYLLIFSRLVRQFFEYSRRSTITIADEVDLLDKYLAIEKMRFEDKLNYNIIIDENIDEENTYIPTLIFQPIVENAVNHGIFHKDTPGLIQIEIIQENDKTIKIIVDDDGIGINKAKDIKKNSIQNYKSNSSAVLHERIDLLNKSNQFKINYKLIDKFDTEKKQGTIVEVTIKNTNED